MKLVSARREAEEEIVDFEVVLNFNRKTGFRPYRTNNNHMMYERESFWYIQDCFGTTQGS